MSSRRPPAHKRQTWPALFAFVFLRTASFFLLCFIATHIVGLVVVTMRAERAKDMVRAQIAEATTSAMELGNGLAHTTEVVNAIRTQDAETLDAIAAESVQQLPTSTLQITDSLGFVLTRTSGSKTTGDNLLLSTPMGRALQTQSAAQSIERRTTTNGLRITTGRTVTDEGKMLGAIFANIPLDSAYATALAATMPPGTQIAWYTKDAGVYASTFSADTTAILSTYFNPQSDWIVHGTTEKNVAFDDASYYFVVNEVFPGLETSPGGVLIFLPRAEYSPGPLFGFLALSVCVFLFFVWGASRRIHASRRKTYIVMVALCGVPIIAFFVWGLVVLKTLGSLHLERSPYPVYNATLSVSPDFGIYQVGSSQRLSIMVHPGDEPVNALQVKMTYVPNVMQVDDIDTSSSPCSMILEETIDEAHGTLTFRCVMFDVQPYQEDFAAAVLHVTFRGEGTSDLRFVNSETSVLANDGLGTEVLRYAQDASYKSAFFSLDPSLGRSFVLFSPTHPNPARWYASDKVNVIWIDALPGRGYRYALDQNPEGSTLTSSVTYAHQATVSVIQDGAYYFHVQAADGGPIATYPVHVDMTAPRVSEFSASSENVSAGEVVRFSFNGVDALSGVQRNFYVDLGNGLFLPVNTTMYLPLLQVGDREIRLRIYDNAGNVAEETKIIHVRAK